jgi:hypothetical protein
LPPDVPDGADDMGEAADGDGAEDRGDAADEGSPLCPGDPTVPDPPPCSDVGIMVDPFYAAAYTCFDLGPVPGVPPAKYGGLTLLPGSCSATLLIGGDANYPEGKLYAIDVARNGEGQISGFVDSAVVWADAPYNDGGVVFGPDDVLFLARWPENELGQILPGSTAPDKVVDLEALGVAYSAAGLNFVPPGFGGAGALKLVSWSGGEWYTLAFSPDGSGTYDIDSATWELTVGGGPEGFVYVSAGNPLFPADSMLLSEWSANRVATYEVDAQGNPDTATRRDFVTAFRGAEGAYRDPGTGDFFFSTWGSGADRVIVVRGFDPIIW